MKLFDKIKDLFMDEIIEDDELELVEENKEDYKEPADILPKVMRETIEKEEIKKIDVSELSSLNNELNTPKTPNNNDKKFSFPMNVDDIPNVKPNNIIRNSSNDIIKEKKELKKEFEIPQKEININNNIKIEENKIIKKNNDLYQRKDEPWVKPKFKASPVISPVYGVLDKNYKKEEVKEKNDDAVKLKRPSKKVDFETVRKKAFGNLADEIKDNLMCSNCELYKEVKRISSLNEDDLLYEMTVDDVKTDKEVTIEKAYDDYEEFGVAYEPKKTVNETVEIKEEIKIETNEAIDEKVNKILEETSIKNIKEEPDEVPSRINNKEEPEDTVDDEFFKLIDSMYKERIDE